MDAALRIRPDLQGCAVRCCHCGIRFFTHPRNAGRQNLRCPFGCRQHHRRQRTNARSKKYYRTDSGRRKKKLLNGKRSQIDNVVPCDVDTPLVSPEQPVGEASSAPTNAGCPSVELTQKSATGVLEPASSGVNLALPLEGLFLNEETLVNSPVLPYARMVASLIEVRQVSRDELVSVLRKRMRQHSIGHRPHREYVLWHLNQHPP